LLRDLGKASAASAIDPFDLCPSAQRALAEMPSCRTNM